MINGCNAFETTRPMSNPISFWTEQDVLRYIAENSIEIASVYGDIAPINQSINQSINHRLTPIASFAQQDAKERVVYSARSALTVKSRAKDALSA